MKKLQKLVSHCNMWSYAGDRRGRDYRREQISEDGMQPQINT